MTSPTAPSPDSDPQSWTSPFEELLDHGTAAPDHGLGASDTHHPHPAMGTPNQDIAFWEGQQHYDDDCAIKCQQFILEQFTGQHLDEDQLVREAAEHGWYAPGHGTMPDNVGNLLELHGIGVTHYEHASQFDLANELAHGHRVMVGVDAGSLWHNADFQGSGHAVVVSGIDTSDPHHVLVQVSDPGTGEALHAYPLEQFLDAWRGTDFTMVATHDPAPAHLPEMAHFDYEAGHIHDVAGVPYDQFITYEDHPADFGDVVHHFVEHVLDNLGLGHDHTVYHHEVHNDLDHLDVHQDSLLDPHHDQHHDPLLDPHHDHDAGHDHADPADHFHDDHTTHDLA